MCYVLIVVCVSVLVPFLPSSVPRERQRSEDGEHDRVGRKNMACDRHCCEHERQSPHDIQCVFDGLVRVYQRACFALPLTRALGVRCVHEQIDLKDVASTSKISIKVRPADKIEGECYNCTICLSIDCALLSSLLCVCVCAASVIELEVEKLNYLYADESVLHFMHPTTFDQIEIDRSLIGDRCLYLVENSGVVVRMNKGQYVSIQVPEKAVCTIATTQPRRTGVNEGFKDATLTNGKVIKVPTFLESGTHVWVNTATDEYLSKADGPPTVQ